MARDGSPTGLLKKVGVSHGWHGRATIYFADEEGWMYKRDRKEGRWITQLTPVINVRKDHLMEYEWSHPGHSESMS